MRITPHEILYCLGLDVPPEGIEVNTNEVRLYIELFRALGETIDVSAIPESALGNLYNEIIRLVGETIDVSTIPDPLLSDLNVGLKKLILACRNKEAYTSRRLDTDMAVWLNGLLDSNHCFINRQHNTEWDPGQLCVLDDHINTYS
ncbi:MAG: hypothetical protein PVI97_04670 [Candidatus Thiodiazotropha sp.]|jgi:hypothetical protein